MAGNRVIFAASSVSATRRRTPLRQLNYAICNIYLRNLVETEYTGNVTDIVLFIGCKTCLLCKLISPEVTVMNLFAILRVSLVG